MDFPFGGTPTAPYIKNGIKEQQAIVSFANEQF
jgi:hypothetical protein